MPIKTGVALDPQLIANATASLMLVPASERRLITDAKAFANANCTLVLFYFPSGGSASDTTQVITRPLVADEEYVITELIGQGVETGGDIQGNDGANGGAAVNIRITYTEYKGTSV